MAVFVQKYLPSCIFYGKLGFPKTSSMYKYRLNVRRVHTVKLAYESFQITEKVTKSPPLLILHGLLGSKRNWQSLAKTFSKTGRRVITVDARNHGESPHVPQMNYELMSEDVERLIHDLHIREAIVLGHSMGGKVAMTLALRRPDLVNKLIVEDVSPRISTSAKSIFPDYLQAMKKVKFEKNLNIVQMRRNLGKELRSIIQDRTVRNFILNNLKLDQHGNYSWKVNIDALLNHIEDIADFPQLESLYSGETLFIAGGLSNRVRKENVPEIKRLFPKARIEFIPKTGHWVHYDSPGDFMQTVLHFLGDR